MARSITVVTTFSDAGWEQYGKRFVETFTQHWPQDIKLKIYCDSVQPGYPEVEWIKLNAACPDLVTFKEHLNNFVDKKVAWFGDCNNVLNSLIAASVKFSFQLNIGCPKNYKPKKFVMDWVKKNKRNINIFHDPKKAVKNADVIFTDKVISLNDRVNIKQKIKEFKKFKIDEKLLNSAKKNVIFLHCLPRGNEVTNEVFLGKKSHVWQQASNRVHVQKSILLYCFGKLR